MCTSTWLAPPIRSPWLAVGTLGIFLTVILVTADNVRWVDIYLAVGMEALLVAIAAVSSTLRMRYWVEFHDSTVTIHSTVLPVRRFDLNRGVAIRTRVYVNATIH